MLTLSIKRKWFDMILSGKKKEEYRDTNDYYTVRFMQLFGIGWFNRTIMRCSPINPDEKPPIRKICLKNGYATDAPKMVIECTISIGEGKSEWGAELNKQYYVLKIIRIIDIQNGGY